MLVEDHPGTRFEDGFGARVAEFNRAPGLAVAGPSGARVAGGNERLLRGEVGSVGVGAECGVGRDDRRHERRDASKVHDRPRHRGHPHAQKGGHMVGREFRRVEHNAIRLGAVAAPSRRPRQRQPGSRGKQVKPVNKSCGVMADHAIPAKRGAGGHGQQRVPARGAGLPPFDGSSRRIHRRPSANQVTRPYQRAQLRSGQSGRVPLGDACHPSLTDSIRNIALCHYFIMTGHSRSEQPATRRVARAASWPSSLLFA